MSIGKRIIHFAVRHRSQRLYSALEMLELRQARARHFPEEQARFDRGDLVVRDMASGGKLNFSAFHSPAFVRTRLLAELQVLEHRPGQTVRISGSSETLHPR